MLKRVRIIAHPSFLFDEFDKLDGKLVEERFGNCNVDSCELNSADVCACHCNILHGVDAPNSLDHCRDLFSVLLDNVPVDFVVLLLDFVVGQLHKCTIVVGGVMEGMDGCRFL
jgi:hypothetical protein